MAEALLNYFRSALPDDLAATAKAQLLERVDLLERGDFLALLQHADTQLLLGHDENDSTTAAEKLSASTSWMTFIANRLETLLAPPAAAAAVSSDDAAIQPYLYFLTAFASLSAFLQSNVTGPPLPFTPANALLPTSVSSDPAAVAALRRQLVLALGVDGEAAYKLTPHIELFCLSRAILTSPKLIASIPAAIGQWARLRVLFLHQRLLSEVAPTLQTAIYEDLEAVDAQLKQGRAASDARVAFLLERATIETHHGRDKQARKDLDSATEQRRFAFALTGLMGKRTKFQQTDTSQLVVLAKSAEEVKDASTEKDKPKNLDLNDDTLLESISFTEKKATTPAASSTDAKDLDSLPEALRELDPSNQPMLQPQDSVILLLLASSIKNTSPDDGMTREETIPYATRVLEGGSSNWQVYTQALLVRSRIEGYKSRTMERGLLQLQALVDQVIAETSTEDKSTDATGGSTTFLPRAKESESAPVNERLRYVFQLASPTRWELEAELASRWVTLGGLRSALEIYERLEMWAEAALCWAATEREDKAKRVVRRQLFHATSGNDDTADPESELWEGPARDPAPADAPRLYCILGDIDRDPELYEKAWEVSRQRYARAQRSLGRYWFSTKDYHKAANAYGKSLKANQLNHGAWFAYGCALLELSQFDRAVEAFSRTVQLDDTDAEAWSNLAAALMNLNPEETNGEKPLPRLVLDDEEEDEGKANDQSRSNPQQHKLDALKAFKRAATLKYDSYRIWDNVLTVAAGIKPPSLIDIITAQKRIIEIRGKSDGERCVDEAILDHLVRHAISTSETGYDPNKPGLTRMIVELVDKQVIPLITSSAALWRTVATLAQWRNQPARALESHEKAWRCVTNQPAWETSSEKAWDEVVEATIQLVDAYESFGPRERTDGLAAGSGQLVAKDWKFKSRSAIRGIMGRGKNSWEDTPGWERLQEALNDLKGRD